MKVYISGKITGDPYYKAKFAHAAADIAGAGHTPINPAMQPEGMSNADYMRISFAQLDSADAVAFLPDWEDSRGARIEHLLVEYTGKPTYDIWAADGRWNFNGLTRDKVMDAMHRCTEVPAEDVDCSGCPMYRVQNCIDELMRAAHELLKNDDFVFSQQEADHGK